MTTLTTPKIHQAYSGPVTIRFDTSGGGDLEAYIETERLHMRPCNIGDIPRYISLFGDREVMKFCHVPPQEASEVQRSVEQVWVKLWQNKSPYSAFLIIKEDTSDFIGYIAVEPGPAPGEAELSCCLHTQFWGQRFGTEAISALVLEYLPQTIAQGYLIGGKTLSKLTAVAKTDNEAARKILGRIGFSRVNRLVGDGSVSLYQKLFEENRHPQTR